MVLHVSPEDSPRALPDSICVAALRPTPAHAEAPAGSSPRRPRLSGLISVRVHRARDGKTVTPMTALRSGEYVPVEDKFWAAK